jgi:hypothetical protein
MRDLAPMVDIENDRSIIKRKEDVLLRAKDDAHKRVQKDERTRKNKKTTKQIAK